MNDMAHRGCALDDPDAALAFGKVRGYRLVLASLHEDDDASVTVLDEIGDCARNASAARSAFSPDWPVRSARMLLNATARTRPQRCVSSRSNLLKRSTSSRSSASPRHQRLGSADGAPKTGLQDHLPEREDLRRQLGYARRCCHGWATQPSISHRKDGSAVARWPRWVSLTGCRRAPGPFTIHLYGADSRRPTMKPRG